VTEAADERDLDAPAPPGGDADEPTPDESSQDEASQALQQENAETSLDQPSS